MSEENKPKSHLEHYVKGCFVVILTAVIVAAIFSGPLFLADYKVAACCVWVAGLLIGGGVSLGIGASIGWFRDDWRYR